MQERPPYYSPVRSWGWLVVVLGWVGAAGAAFEGHEDLEVRGWWSEGLALEQRDELLESSGRYERIAEALPGSATIRWRLARNYWRHGERLPIQDKRQREADDLHDRENGAAEIAEDGFGAPVLEASADPLEPRALGDGRNVVSIREPIPRDRIGQEHPLHAIRVSHRVLGGNRAAQSWATNVTSRASRAARRDARFSTWVWSV